ncbi:D-erythronate dehydrogenase-like [Leguminivora glycinivorella]|uniref:D-erythronate dehydrogenase-like n=1 Tax=Leguminivora glycinivorella TaxID=1035111 RepID=UPI00200E54DB|nr:D-erythronate dehydrogenase-like [Leguminivora glycinivorella]
MKVVITGAAGFLGSRLAKALLSSNSSLAVSELVLVDVTAPGAPPARVPVRAVALDLAAPGAAEQIIEPDTAVVFHLAAIVSGNAEKDFDLGFRVNFDATRALLEAARRRANNVIFVMSSTVAVYGGKLPDAPDEDFAPMPQTSYGCAKAMAELLAREYGRRGWADARVVRLPTVAVRGGSANTAISSFASDIVREPLAGRAAVVPVPPELRMWVSGPATAVHNLVHAAALPAEAWRARRVVSLPGLTVATGEMAAALARVCGAACAARVRWAPDAALAAMMGSVPARLAAHAALRLGFREDQSYDDLIREYIRDDLGGRVPQL